MRFEWKLLASFVLICNLAAGAAIASGASCVLGPTDFLVYSLRDIRASRSDFEGPTGAAGSISLESFLISAPGDCPSVVAGSGFELFRSEVRGGVEIGGTGRLVHARVTGRFVHGGGLSLDRASVGSEERESGENAGRLALLSSGFLAASDRISKTPLEHHQPILGPGALRFEGGPGIREFELDARQLRPSTVMEFSGPSDALFIVNVRGRAATIAYDDMILRDGIGAGQILLNFPDATRLSIRRSGSYESGIAATILAPRASVDFRSARITGALYVGDLTGDGQVNFAPFPWEQIPLPGTPEEGCGQDPNALR